jgi:signal transduction histidine kinase/ActR/RegA family two-component response regulator
MGETQRPAGDLTFFAEPGRVGDRELAVQVEQALADPCVQVVLEAVQGYLLILNRQRQVLAGNRELLDALERDDPGCVIGLRPGEALNCAHFTEGPDGCGTAPHCRACGAVLAILASQESGTRSSGECRLSALENGKLVARDFRVTCTPLAVGGNALTALVLTDISSEKRREALERTFLHDFLNSLGGIEGWSRLLSESDPETAAREILALAETLKEGIVSHRTLLLAEKGDLVVEKRVCDAADVLAQLRAVFETHAARNGRRFEIAPVPEGAVLTTEPGLLLRVLVNMVKNAFEAIEPGAAVRVWFEWREGRPGFVVHNPGVIAADVQPHLFERSFSTKGNTGRGLGTYSMKLYGERYLGGSVSYASEPDTGTSFRILLPAEPGPTAAPQAPQPPAPAKAAAPARRVLLVEDDEPLGRLASIFLKRLGLEVVLCGDGVEAEDIFRRSPEAFTAVITDARMPRMGGMQLGRRLLEMRPGLPVYLCTGALDQELNQAARDVGFRGVIAKPYSIQSLAKVLEAMLQA